MIGFELTPAYNPAEYALHYERSGNITEVPVELNELEREAMQFALSLAGEALADGNPPVGAVLIVNNGEHTFAAKTHDKTSRHLMGHAELVAYEDAHKVIGDDMSTSTLVTTAAPCSSCTPHYAEGKIARIVTAAPRRYIYQISGLMRPRAINMHELLTDGDTETTLVLNHQLERSLGLFALYGKRKGYQVPDSIDEFLRPVVQLTA